MVVRLRFIIPAVLLISLAGCNNERAGVEPLPELANSPQLSIVRNKPQCQLREGQLLLVVRNDGGASSSSVNTWLEARFSGETKRVPVPVLYPDETAERLFELPSQCSNCSFTARIVEGAGENPKIHDEVSASCSR